MALYVKWILLAVIASIPSLAAAQEQIPWGNDLAKAMKQARDERKLVLVHFYADSCVPCRSVEQKVFPQAEVVQAIGRNYVPVKINADKAPEIATHYNVRGWPTDVFLTSAGQEVHRDVTKQSAADYVTLLDQLAIQAGVGSARQAALHERESRYEGQAYQPAGDQPVARQNMMVQNQYAPNRYAAEGYGPSTQPVETNLQQQRQLPSDAGVTAWQPAFPPSAPSHSEGFQPPPANGNPNPSPASSPNHEVTQKATWQGPDITAPQLEIRNQFVPVDKAPPVALEGFCPVSICPSSPTVKGSWKKGDHRFGAVHRGRTYLFASKIEQDKFMADPDAYSPVLSGADVVLFAERGELVEGNRNFGVVLPAGGRNQVFFFADAETRARFEQAPKQYAVTAYQAMMRSETGKKFR